MAYVDCKHFDPTPAIWVIATKLEYLKTASGKSWQRNPATTKTTVETADFYKNYVQASRFFKSRDFWEFTKYGYLPTRITTVSPYEEKKIVMLFTPIPGYRMKTADLETALKIRNGCIHAWTRDIYPYAIYFQIEEDNTIKTYVYTDIDHRFY